MGSTCSPLPEAPDLDIRIDVYDAAGQLVGTADPPAKMVSADHADGLAASFLLPARGRGHTSRGSTALGSVTGPTDGYSDYGSLGRYTISVGSGTSVPGPAPYVAPSPAATGGGSCRAPDYNDLQTAVTAAAAGRTIHVCAGTYALAIELTVTKRPRPRWRRRRHVDRGDGGSAHRILNATGHALSLRGLTLRNGATSGGADGGAVIAGALTIEYCVFTGNAGGTHGGAAFGSDSATARHSTFIGNHTTRGSDGGRGGVRDSYESVARERQHLHRQRPWVRGALHAYFVTVANSTFAGNSAEAAAAR